MTEGGEGRASQLFLTCSREKVSLAASNCEELGLFEAIGSKWGKKTLAFEAERFNVRENKNELNSF